MTDRIVIEVSGDLPDEGKYAILASAEELAKKLAADLVAKHSGVDPDLSVSVRAVRPSKKAATPATVVQRRAAE